MAWQWIQQWLCIIEWEAQKRGIAYGYTKKVGQNIWRRGEWVKSFWKQVTSEDIYAETTKTWGTGGREYSSNKYSSPTRRTCKTFAETCGFSMGVNVHQFLERHPNHRIFWGLVARVLMRTITEGSTSVMQLGKMDYCSVRFVSFSQKRTVAGGQWANMMPEKNLWIHCYEWVESMLGFPKHGCLKMGFRIAGWSLWRNPSKGQGKFSIITKRKEK